MNNCDFISISDVDLDFSSENVEELQNPSPKKSIEKTTNENNNKSNNQKKRPPRKAAQKINILESLDFDKLMDGIENEEVKESSPIINKTEKKVKKKNIGKEKKIDFIPFDIGLNIESKPLESFEKNILNYLQSTTKDLIPIFLAELKYNLDGLFDYNKQIHDFLSQLRVDIENVINEQSLIINTELNKERNYLDFGFYFDELTLSNHSSDQQLLANHSSENKHIYPATNFLISTEKIIKELQVTKDRIYDNMLPKLKKIKSESTQLKNQLKQCSKSDENQKKLSNIRYTVEKEQMILDFYEKQIQEVCYRQTKLRNHFQSFFEYQHKTFHLNDNENDDNEDYDFIKNELMDLLKDIKFSQSKIEQKKIRKSDLEKINMNIASIKGDIKDIFEKSKKLQIARSNNQSKSYQVSDILNMPISSSDYYSNNNQSCMNISSNSISNGKIRSNNLVLSNIRKRLENVQKISRENNYLLANM